jgi:hypothetical protein
MQDVSLLLLGLAGVGLTSREWEVVSVMVTTGPLKMSELFAMTGFDRSNTYKAIRGLRAKEIIESGPELGLWSIRPQKILERGQEMWSKRPQAQLEPSGQIDHIGSLLNTDLSIDIPITNTKIEQKDVVNSTTSQAQEPIVKEKDVVNSTTKPAKGRKREGKKQSPEAKEAVDYLIEAAVETGIPRGSFGGDFRMRCGAVADSMMADPKITLPLIKTVIDRMKKSEKWKDKLSHMAGVRDAIRCSQNKKGGIGSGGPPTTNGHPDRRYSLNPTTVYPETGANDMPEGPYH